ncbi:MAG: hypothetical protein MJ250_09720 [Alphaproteobacteria bacterium]|nr:hypothetical protein [Alphaproteobacteria bacterium]
MNEVTTTNNQVTNKMSGSEKAKLARTGIIVGGILTGLAILAGCGYSFSGSHKNSKFEAHK